MKAKETLETALELVTGDRAEQHGDMHEVHETTAALWNVYIGHYYDAKDVAIMLALLKVAREKCTPGNPDNLVDFCGYGAIAAELSEVPSKVASFKPIIQTAAPQVQSTPTTNGNGHIHETPT